MILRRRTANGKIRYGVRVDRAGKQVWVGTFTTLAEARKRESEARGENLEKPMACDEWARFWLDGYRERVKLSSYDTAKASLAGFIEDFRGIPLSRVDEIRAERWARENRWRIPTVVTLFNAAVKARLVSRNPFAGRSRKGEGRKRMKPLTESEVRRLAQAARETHGQSLRALVLFLAYTGIRPGEAFALEWSDVDLERGRALIERRAYRGELDVPKSGRSRLIVVPPPARDAILPLKGEGIVFRAKRGGRLSQSGVAYYWQAIGAKFGRKVAPYELRHFAAHHLYVTMGLPARVVATQLGHDGPKLVETLYGHGDVGALEEIDRAFSNVIPLRAQSQEQ